MVLFGEDALMPQRRQGETWEDCFWRECVHEAPDWIAVRAVEAIEAAIKQHEGHGSYGTFPQVKLCPWCTLLGSWKDAAVKLYSGDPGLVTVSLQSILLPMAPMYFRKGARKMTEAN